MLSCADSRIAPELCFDTARGDLIVCRIAGNFASDEMVAAVQELLKKDGIRAVNYGVVGIPNDEAEARKIFRRNGGQARDRQEPGAEAPRR